MGSIARWSLLENLEARLVLSVPAFATPLADNYQVTAGKPIQLGIDGSDSSNSNLSITAVSDNPNVTTTVLPSGVSAWLATAFTGTNNDLYFQAKQTGTAGNSITVAFTTGAQNSTPVVSVNGNAISIQILAGSTTANQVITAVANSAAASALVAVAKAGANGTDANDGSGTVSASAATNLSGGAAQNFALLHFVSGDAAHTPIGDVLVELFGSIDPVAVNRFTTLATKHINTNGTIASSGTPFYSNVVVHRVIPDFMIQTGDAAKGDGTGNSPLPNVIDPSTVNPGVAYSGTGVLALARTSSPNSSNCQFFITDAPYNSGDGTYLILGQVISGMDVVEQVVDQPRDDSDRPWTPPLLQSVSIIDSSSQDGTVVVTPNANFTGQAHVTISLSNGSQAVQKIVTIADSTGLDALAGDRPTIAHIADVTMPANNKTITFASTITDDINAPMTFTSRSTVAGVTATVDPATHDVTVTAPADFTGVAKVTIGAVESGWGNLVPTEQTFYVTSTGTGAPPIISPRLVPTGTSSTVMAAVRSGNLLLEAAMSDGLKIFNITDPSNPQYITTVNVNGNARDVKVVTQGNRTVAYVTAEAGGLVAVNITDPAHAAILDSVAGDSSSGRYAVSLDIVGNVAYVAEWGAGLTTYNIMDPTAIQRITSISTLKAATRVSAALKLNYATSVKISGNYAYVADAAGAIDTINVADTTKMSFVSNILTTGGPWGMSLDGTNLFVSEGSPTGTNYNPGRLDLYSIASPTKPKLVSYLPIMGNPQFVDAQNQLAVVGEARGFQVVDFSDPKNMQVIDNYIAPARSNQAYFTGSTLALPMGDDQTILVDAQAITNRVVVHGTATFMDENQVPVTVKVTGGTAIVTTSGAGSGSILDISSPDATAKTTITISTPKGTTTTIHGATFTGGIKSFVAPTAKLDGDFSVGGTIATLTMGDVLAGSTIGVGTPAAADKTQLALTLGQVTDLKLTSDEPVKSLSVVNWTDTDGLYDIVTPFIGTLTAKGDTGVAGDFQADLHLTGSGTVTNVLGTAKIAHDLSGSTWRIVGQVGNVTVTGTALDSSLRAVAFGAITVGASDGSDFLAGVAGGLRHPVVAGDLGQLNTIKSFKVTGWKVPADPTRVYFQNSNVAAGIIGTVNLLNIKYDNGGTAFGIWARTPALPTAKAITKVSDADTEQVFTNPPLNSFWKYVTTKWTYPGASLPMTDFDITVF